MGKKVEFEKIKKLRLERGMTQVELAEATGVNVSVIKSQETGRSDMNYDYLLKIAEGLGVDIGDIYIEDYRETKVITVANNKGGSGKTSVVASLGHTLSDMGKKVLLIDSDMQMNLSYSYGFERDRMNLNEAIVNEEDLGGYIRKTDFDNLDIIISDFEMATIEMHLFTKTLRETVFKRLLRKTVESGVYDFIIIDTNPTLGMLNLNILNASDYVIVPVEMSAFGILGLEVLIKFINQAQEINEKLELAGVLRTKVDKRESITSEADEVLMDVFGEKIFDAYIPIDTNVKKAQWERQPLNVFNKSSRANKQYTRFAKELMAIVK
ncbi:sporulation initiation inhibitor protein Soj [Andreesenia angusta]|uniref:Sporulation initiation inhibitor protein Soj n=1 Tax=Andreesenia angusta TaxID=39480 RepID=A0A1S1V588_9FIRM|nr:AAA family ATPase [Andreesenia angusta]OHW61277.1 sporulation initiation inhibitor protein Soj [Andreesenia angusta]